MTNNGWIKYLVGVLVTIVVIIAIPTMARSIWENDRMSRDRDSKLHEKIDTKCQEIQREQLVITKETNAKFEKIMVGLAEVTTDLKYVKAKL